MQSELGASRSDDTSRLSSYRDLRVWQASFELGLAAYAVARRLPRDERFELGSQIRRAAISIPSNIAEGYGRLHRGDYVRHLSIANGSLKELETQLDFAQRLGFVAPEHVDRARERAAVVGRMLASMIRRLRVG